MAGKSGRRLTRAEKSELTRRNLLAAAVQVVGEQGYGGASVTSITSRAKIAQGTFYNYFQSKQEILDELLPELGRLLLEYLGEKVGGSTYLEREERSLRAYSDFIRERPEFFRILTEAQVHAPSSYARHAENLTRNYVAALRRNKTNGYLKSYSESEFETLAVILLGARVQLMGHYCLRGGRAQGIPEPVIGTFMKFLDAGFGEAGPTRRVGARRAAVRPEWYAAIGESVSEAGLGLRYQIPGGADVPASADEALQILVADLLRRGAGSLYDGGARIRSNGVHLFARRLPATIRASLRVAAVGAREFVASFELSGPDGEGAETLASGQAILSRD